MLDQRGQLLRAAVGFATCSMPSYDRALHALRTWLDSWSGIGHVAVGMHRQGYDLQLTQYDDRGSPVRLTMESAAIRALIRQKLQNTEKEGPYDAICRQSWGPRSLRG